MGGKKMTTDTKMQMIPKYTLGKYLVGGSFLGRFDFSIMETKIHTFLGWGGWSKIKSDTKIQMYTKKHFWGKRMGWEGAVPW